MGLNPLKTNAKMVDIMYGIVKIFDKICFYTDSQEIYCQSYLTLGSSQSATRIYGNTPL